MDQTKTIENLFIFLDIASSLVPLFFFVKNWKRSFPELGLRFLAIYSVLILFINALLYFYQDSIVLYETFTIIESIAFFSFLYVQIRNVSVKKAIIATGIAFELFNVLYPVFTHGVKLIDSVQIGIETIIILVFSFYYLYEKMNDTTTLYIYSTFPFWIVIGMIVYLSGSFFIYIFADSLTKKQVDQYWIVTNILSIMKNIFFAIAIIVHSKPTRKLPMSEFEFSSLN